MKIVDIFGRARRAVTARIHILLLAAFPFADQLMGVIAANLPAAADYLPANVYKWVGLAVVVFHVMRDLVKRPAIVEGAAK